jgi:ATP-dependent helicase HrpB
LELTRISRASATQRAGRAGRQRPGRAVALWTEDEDRSLKDADLPEIRRSDLSSTLLLLVDWGVGKPESFGWFEAPAPSRLEASLALLQSLGALETTDGVWRATAFGRELLRYPADPRTAALLARTSDPEAARIAAELQEGAARPSPQSERVARELSRLQRGGPFSKHSLHEALILAYADKVARRREPGSSKAVQVGGRGLVIEDAMLPAKAEHFLALAAHEGSGGSETRVVRAEPVSLEELRRLRPEAFRDLKEHRLDESTHKVSATRTLFYEDLAVDGPHSVPVDPTEVAKLQKGQGSASRLELLRKSCEGYAKWELRLRFLEKHAPELGFAPPSAELLESFFDTFPESPSWSGAWRGFFEGFWSFEQKKTFEAEAPSKIVVPTEREIPLEYADDASEVKCAVRLQELFGWLESPAVAKGRKKVTMELLSPGYKPVQITKDLASFWRSAYFDVRKDLRTRYPKHSWPEDPLTAKPEAKGRSRR